MTAVIVSTVLLLVLLFTPLGLYLAYGWTARRRQVLDLFPDGAVTLYYTTYFPASARQATTRQAFVQDFDDRYGRRHFVAPAAVLFAVASFLLFLCINTVAHAVAGPLLLSDWKLPLPAVACVAGAYVWVVFDFVVRERSLDFSTTHVNRASFRLAVSVPLAYAIPWLLAEELRLPAAILLGAFPTDTVMWILRRRAGQVFGLGETPDDQPTRLENLPSVDTATADRIRMEGITSVGQLANADPIALTIRTGLSFGFVLDCISEALAWYYLGKAGLAAGQACSVPGALEVAGLVDELDYVADPADPNNDRYLKDQQLAVRTLAVIAEKLGMDRDILERILRTIWDDSRVQFLAELMETIEKMRGESPGTWGGAGGKGFEKPPT